MVRKINTEPFAEKTGRSWEQWVAFLDGIGAKEMSHGEIAQRVLDTGDATGWWSQSITVAYEQHIGRRAPGQQGDRFRVSATRTLPGSIVEVTARWHDLMTGCEQVAGSAYARGPKLSGTDKRKHWRCALADGTGVAVSIESRAPGKTLVAVEHDKLASAADMETRRTYWKARLGEL